MSARKTSRLLCPTCGHLTRPAAGPGGYVCGHGNCRAELDRRYAQEALPQTIIACVGFQGHGKTLLLTSLLGSLVDGLKHNLGSNCVVEATNREAFQVVDEGWSLLKKGQLPPGTDIGFHIPGIARAEGIGGARPRSLIFFDVAGGAFKSWSIDLRIASMFSIADVLWVMCSAVGEVEVRPQLQLLMQAYVNHTVALPDGAASLGRKRVIVIYTKGDRLGLALEKTGYADVANYLAHDPLPVSREYVHILRYMSNRLADFTCKHVPGGRPFHAMCQSRFHSLEYCVVSALGGEPDSSNRLLPGVNPRRVVDPLVLAVEA